MPCSTRTSDRATQRQINYNRVGRLIIFDFFLVVYKPILLLYLLHLESRHREVATLAVFFALRLRLLLFFLTLSLRLSLFFLTLSLRLSYGICEFGMYKTAKIPNNVKTFIQKSEKCKIVW